MMNLRVTHVYPLRPTILLLSRVLSNPVIEEPIVFILFTACERMVGECG